jgi:protein-arginine kinase activator protein McsA
MYVGIEIVVRITGGDLAGGIHYEPHSIQELKNHIPKFVITFVLIFIGTFIYNSLSKRKNLVCPNCEHAFVSFKSLKESQCPNCSSIGEIADGFYNRHPEFKKIKNEK